MSGDTRAANAVSLRRQDTANDSSGNAENRSCAEK